MWSQAAALVLAVVGRGSRGSLLPQPFRQRWSDADMNGFARWQFPFAKACATARRAGLRRSIMAFQRRLSLIGSAFR